MPPGSASPAPAPARTRPGLLKGLLGYGLPPADAAMRMFLLCLLALFGLVLPTYHHWDLQNYRYVAEHGKTTQGTIIQARQYVPSRSRSTASYFKVAWEEEGKQVTQQVPVRSGEFWKRVRKVGKEFEVLKPQVQVKWTYTGGPTTAILPELRGEPGVFGWNVASGVCLLILLGLMVYEWRKQRAREAR